MTERLLQRNVTHLSMSGESPFVRGRTAVDDILNGEFDIDTEGLDEATASTEMHSFIKALKIPNSKDSNTKLKEMGIGITSQDYVDIFSKTRESTASSPSGIHYGHYIAACESELLINVNLIFMTTPFHIGKPLTRWTKSLHCMIQKKREIIH